jgi:hypothetical protein
MYLIINGRICWCHVLIRLGFGNFLDLREKIFFLGLGFGNFLDMREKIFFLIKYPVVRHPCGLSFFIFSHYLFNYNPQSRFTLYFGHLMHKQSKNTKLRHCRPSNEVASINGNIWYT